MALQYETGTPSTIEDLVDKLQTFWALHSLTVNDIDLVNDECTLSDGGNLFVHFGWDATGEDLNICQSLGYTGGNAIDAMPNDSGVGSATIGNERIVNFVAAGPFTAYHFFLEDGGTGDPIYCHVVVERTVGVYRHFGFGNIDKINDWTGGEYVYGHTWSQTVANIDNPLSISHTLGLDGVTSVSNANGTMHLRDIGDMAAADRWGIFKASLPGTDTAGEDRWILFGGPRDGAWHRPLRHIHNANLNSYVPILPLPVVYRDTGTAPDTWVWLGQQPNIGHVNMFNFIDAQEITLGGETWMVFPWVKKQFLQDDTEESWNGGVAYRKS